MRGDINIYSLIKNDNKYSEGGWCFLFCVREETHGYLVSCECSSIGGKCTKDAADGDSIRGGGEKEGMN